MPRYDYECPVHGRTEIIKPMSEAGALEICGRCATPDAVMRRVYNPQGFIMRPSGYNLRPGDHGYDNFDREMELGEIRDPGEKAESGGAKVSIPRPRIDTSTVGVAAERNLRQAVEAAIVEV